MLMNTVVLIGRLTKDPELTKTESTSIGRFTLAVDREGKNNSDKADFIWITCFGAQAETVNKYLAKGRQVAVLGRIQTGNYKNKEGETVYTTDVVANRVEFLGSPGGGGQKTGSGESADGPQTDSIADIAEEVETDVPF